MQYTTLRDGCGDSKTALTKMCRDKRLAVADLQCSGDSRRALNELEIKNREDYGDLMVI